MDIELNGKIIINDETKEKLMDNVREEVRKTVLEEMSIEDLAEHIKKNYSLVEFYTLIKKCMLGVNGCSKTLETYNRMHPTSNWMNATITKKLFAIEDIVNI